MLKLHTSEGVSIVDPAHSPFYYLLYYKGN